jgi:hypothetical protein
MSFAVVCPKIKLTQTKFDLAPGLSLERATAEQGERIRDFVGDTLFFGQSFRSYFECEHTPTDKPDEFHETKLNPEFWHYHVVNFSGNDSSDIEILGHVLAFKSLEMFLGMKFFDNGSISAHAVKLTHTMATMFMASGFRTVHEIAPGDAAWISKWFLKIKAIVDDEVVMAPLKRRRELLHLPLYSNAHVLGLFSILEMIITHQPVDKDLHDSLTHQVATKMALLNRKFERSALYHFFEQASHEDVWKALYEYRSKIAHGVRFDFKQGKLQKLKNESAAHGFLNDAVGLLLRLWIEESDFLADLKKC